MQLQQDSTKKLDSTLVSKIKLISIKDPCDISKVNWKTVIDNSIFEAKQRVRDKEVNLKIDINSIKEFHADHLLLEMMMEELFANSMQYNLHAEAIINIKIKDANNDVLIEVLDNGIGIREEEKEKIFEMFYKNEKSKGSGLGLYIVKNIVEKMKGSITLESYKNQGTKLQIIMPFIEGKQTC